MTIPIEKRHYDAHGCYERQSLHGLLAKIKCHCQIIASRYFYQDLMGLALNCNPVTGSRGRSRPNFFFLVVLVSVNFISTLRATWL